MENSYNEVEDLKEQIYDLQNENYSYVIKNIDLKQKIAMLQDGFEYQKDMADTYAKALKEIWDYLDELIDGMADDEAYKEDLKQIKKSIPESALQKN